MSISGFDFGQSERLTIRLKGLIRSYPRGIGILKEFIQNADDATATRLSVVMDWRQHVGERLPDPRMKRMMGPALLLANNRRFTELDLQAIRHIGESSKLTSGPKTGRFGLGFNTSYNVSDYPSFLTNDAIYCFDPHQNAAAQAPGFGKGWKLAQLWKSAPDWPAVFDAAGLKHKTADHDGTIFRLPVRTVAQAAESEICDEAYAREDFTRLVAQGIAHGTELLLFTKNLVELTIDEIDEGGSRTRRLTIRTTNQEEVEAARTEIREAISGDLAKRLDDWSASKGTLPLLSYVHRFEVGGDESREESWAVINGFARGDKDRLLDAARQMMRHGEKALPWVGAAARIDETQKTVLPSEGQLYCGMPLSVPVKLPIHLNGYFDLDASRQKLTVDTGSGDAAAALQARVQWNEALIEQGASWAWSRLLRRLCETYPESIYAIWPDPGDRSMPLLERLTAAVYRTTARWALIRVRCGDEFARVAPQDLKIPPHRWRSELFEPLTADGLPLPDPPLPPHVEQGFHDVIQAFTPAALRERLRITETLNVKIADAPRACLRQRGWVELLLRYCLSDEQKDLWHLPLAILCDGHLRAFGFNLLFLATAEEREIFKPFPYWFVDPKFQKATELAPIGKSSLVQMSPEHLVVHLHNVLSNGSPRAYQPAGSGVPNRKWLSRLLQYLTSAKLQADFVEKLKQLPFVPGSDEFLYHPAQPSTPLLPPVDEEHSAMLEVLRTIGIPLVDSELLEPCRRFAAAKADLIVGLSGPALMSGLYERRDRLSTLTKDSAALLLDFLAEARWSYKDVVLHKLRSLRILPTGATLVAATDAQVYLPSDFKPPAIGLKVQLLSSAERWQTLYQRMQIPLLDAWRYLLEALLPALPSLAEEDQVRALRWIRDNHLGRLLGADEQATKDKLSSLAVVQASDGKVHAISELHDPKSELVRDVLGEAALYPNMDFYRDRPESWLRFFRELGMAEHPRPQEVLQHIKSMIPRGRAAEKELRRVFNYLKDGWKDLSELPMRSGKAKASLARSLADLPFFPALNESDKPGFLAPEPRLYCAHELALDEDLVGSQAPVAAWNIPAAMAKDLNFRRVPELLIVLRHFQHLLDLWALPNRSELAAEQIGTALSEIYRYLGRFQDGPSRDGDASFVLSARDRQVLKQFENRECIWDPARKKLWLPKHTFAVPIPFFDPRRATIDLQKGSVNQALNILGRRETPTAADYVEFLFELQEDALAERPRLTDAEHKQALYALQQLADEEQIPVGLPLLTRDGGLASAGELMQDDAPWLRDRTQQIRIVAPEVPLVLVERLNVKALSECIEERLVDGSSLPVEQSAQEACQTLAKRLRLPGFLKGLRRLVQHCHSIDAEPDLKTIQSLRLQPVASLYTEVVLADGRSLGRAVVKHFFDATENALFVTSTSLSRIVPALARTLSRLLDTLSPPDLAPLEHILGCEDDSEISDCLDEDHIKEFTFSDELVDWEQPEATQLAEDHIEESVEAQESFAQQSTHDELPDEAPSARQHGYAEGGSWIPHPSSSTGSSHPGSFSGGRMEHLIQRLLDAPIRKDPEQPWTEAIADGPPGEPGIGRSLVERGGSGGGVVLLAPDGSADNMTEAERQKAEEVEEAALQYVLKSEVEEERMPQRMPVDHPGYDIRSQGTREDDVRYIQVKGLGRDWRDRPVMLTPAQVEAAVRLGKRSWLYVVERLEGSPKLHQICDLAAKIGRFRIDASWAMRAEGAPPPTEPVKGHKIYEGDNLLGTIASVRVAGSLQRLTILQADGTKKSIAYKPGVHRLESADGNDPT